MVEPVTAGMSVGRGKDRATGGAVDLTNRMGKRRAICGANSVGVSGQQQSRNW